MVDDVVQHQSCRPVLMDESQGLLEVRRGRLQPRAAGDAQHERGHPLRVHRREHGGDGPAVGDAQERGPLQAHGVHHRPDVIHAPLEGAGPEGAVGQAGAPLVQDDQPAEREEPFEERAGEDVLPVELDVRHEPGDEDQVDRSVPDDLVGDAQPIAGGELGLRVPWHIRSCPEGSRNEPSMGRDSSHHHGWATGERSVRWRGCACRMRVRVPLRVDRGPRGGWPRRP